MEKEEKERLISANAENIMNLIVRTKELRDEIE